MGIFDFFLKKDKKFNPQVTSVENLFTPYFSGAYDPELNTTYTSICDAHARHLSKLKFQIMLKDQPSNNKQKLKNILTLRMNPTMSASVGLEIIAREYFMSNTALVYIERDYSDLNGESVKALWPLDPDSNSLQLVTNKGRLYVKFYLDGNERTVSEDDLLIIPRGAKPSTLFGQQSRAVDTVLKVIQTQYEGIEQAIRTSAFVRFLITGSTVMKDEVKKERAEAFAEAYLGSNSKGVAFVDNADKVIPVKSNGNIVDDKQMDYFKKEIFNYLTANEEYLQATYDENGFQSIYEAALEPFVVKLLDEMNYKLFSQNERNHGNRIIADVNPIQTASLKTRISIAQTIMKLPIVKPNQIADLLYLPKLENGDKEFGFLNWTDAEKLDEYQGVDDPKDGDDNNGEEEKRCQAEMNYSRKCIDKDYLVNRED